ncbi:MAG: ribosomal protection tetracycline resistance protein, partial [Actinomycetota bacterium]|nr:ribosomal protection tetracycline resistance protein [Actinomycetota bacterium]
VHPVLSGSAITGAGVADLVTAMAELLPATERTGDGPLSATVFKIDREQTAALFTALTRLSEEDPLIDVRCRGHDVSVRLCGEVQKEVLREAGTRVYEPAHRFELEIPANAVSAVLLKLAELRAMPGEPAMGPASCTLHWTIPAGHVDGFTQALPALTGGEGVFLSDFDDYRPYPGKPPVRPRTGENPLDRKEYLARVARR